MREPQRHPPSPTTSDRPQLSHNQQNHTVCSDIERSALWAKLINKQIQSMMKLSSPERPNYSRYAKICDLTFYHESTPSDNAPINYESPSPHPKPPIPLSTSFSSVPRQKPGNFAFPIRLPRGQFSHHPNASVGRQRSPSWSFSKQQRYHKQPHIQFQVCRKCPLLHEDQQVSMRASTTSMKELIRDKVKMMRSTSYYSKDQQNQTQTSLKDPSSKETAQSNKNYSIISPRETSPVKFFNSTKIKQPKYLSREDLVNLQAKLDDQAYQRRCEPCPKGYIEFHRRRGRKTNTNHKQFEDILYAYNDERQFANFQSTAYPTHPEHHINMQDHLDRPDYTPNRLGPNTNIFPIDAVRPAQNKINLNLATFRDRVTTRLDRVGAQPNTILDYEKKQPELGGMVQMNRMVGRPNQLFPVIDPIIKKPGDKQMKIELQRHRPIVDINEALRHKNVENYTLLAQQAP